MKIISSLPNTGAPTANHDQGEIEDDITPGDGNGTPLREDWINDVFYGLYEIMKLAGLSPDDSAEGDTQSQVRNAIQAIANGVTVQQKNTAVDYTILDNDFFRTIYVDTTAADATIDLPVLANNIGRKIRIVHARGGTNKVIIAPDSGDANTLTSDALAVIWLPKLGDYIDFENNDIIGALLWQSVSERISCQIKLQEFGNFGSGENKIMQFVNEEHDYGNMFTNNHAGYGTSGLKITILRSGNYSFNFASNLSAAAVGELALSINSTNLSTIPLSLTPSKLLTFMDLDTDRTGNITWSGYLQAGDIIRPHIGPGTNPPDFGESRFNASYLGN